MQPTPTALIEKVREFRAAIEAVDVFGATAIAGEIATIIKGANIQIPKFWAPINSENRELEPIDCAALNEAISDIETAASKAYAKNTAACAAHYSATPDAKELPHAIDPATIVHITHLVIALIKMFRDRQKA